MKGKKRKDITKDDDRTPSVPDTEENEVEQRVLDVSSEPHISSKHKDLHDGGDDDDNDTAEVGGAQTKRKRKKKKKKDSDINPNTSTSAESEKSNQDDTLSNAEKLKHVDYTIYVEGLPFDCTEDEVQEFFTSHGCSDILDIRLPKWQDSGRLRGYGHIVFQSVDSCQKAIHEIHGKTLKTRYVTIQPAHALKGSSSSSSSTTTTQANNRTNLPPTQPQGCKTIFVKNLPYDNCNEADLEKVFSIYGKIVPGGVRLVRNSVTRHSKGFAYMEYKNPEGAYAAVSNAYKKGIQIHNRTCVVDYDDGGRVKDSFRTANGQLWKSEYSTKQKPSSKKPTTVSRSF